MKVVILVTQLEGGGAQRASFRLSDEFNKRNIDCSNWFLYTKRDNISGSNKFVSFLERPIKSPVEYVGICIRYYRLLKNERPDVLITFTHYANVLGLSIAWLAGVKVRIASHRNPSWGDYPKSIIGIDRLFAENGVYSAVTAVSKSTKNSFSHYDETTFSKIEVINNGLTFQRTSSSKEDARRLCNLPVNCKIIGTIGRLSQQKNQQTIIKAIHDLPDVHFAIAGDGELAGYLRDLIQSLGLTDRVHLLGEMSYTSIPIFLKSLDVYVMPSLFEGLSNALVEAMSASLPVISSDVDAQQDVVVSEDGIHNGILLPASDSVAWTKTIGELLSDTERLANLSERSSKRASQFTIEKMADGFLKVIYSCIKEFNK